MLINNYDKSNFMRSRMNNLSSMTQESLDNFSENKGYRQRSGSKGVRRDQIQKSGNFKLDQNSSNFVSQPEIISNNYNSAVNF